MAGVYILLQTYNAILHMADGFKKITDRQHNSGRAQTYKTGVGFVRPEELKEKRTAGMTKSPQSEAVAAVHKKDNGTMLQNEVGHSN